MSAPSVYAVKSPHYREVAISGIGHALSGNDIDKWMVRTFPAKLISGEYDWSYVKRANPEDFQWVTMVKLKKIGESTFECQIKHVHDSFTPESPRTAEHFKNLFQAGPVERVWNGTPHYNEEYLRNFASVHRSEYDDGHWIEYEAFTQFLQDHPLNTLPIRSLL